MYTDSQSAYGTRKYTVIISIIRVFVYIVIYRQIESINVG